MLKSSLYDYNDVYKIVKVIIKTTGTAAYQATTQAHKIKKQVVLKNCVPFNDSISKINNKQVHNVKDLDVVMPMYNLTEYSHNYAKLSGSLWQY